MTHMLPRVARAVKPWLRNHVADARFWDGEYDPTHTGEIVLPEPTEEDRRAMFSRYMERDHRWHGEEIAIMEAEMLRAIQEMLRDSGTASAGLPG